MEAWRPVHAVAIEQRHRRHIEAGAGLDQRLGQGSPLEKAERRAGVEFDIQRSTQYLAFSIYAFG